MAHNEDQYRLNYVESELGERFMCGVCLDVMTDAMETCCGHCFCEMCLLQSLNSTRMKCPACWTALDGSLFHPLYNLRREIDNLNVHCFNWEIGCPFVAPQGRLQAHERRCRVDRIIVERRGSSGTEEDPSNHPPRTHEGAHEENESTEADGGDHDSPLQGDLSFVGFRRASVTEEDLDYQHPTQTRVKLKDYCCSRKRIIIPAVVVVGLLAVGAVIFGMLYVYPRTSQQETTNWLNYTMNWLKSTCQTPGDLCTDGSNTILRCDLVTSECLIQAQQSCSGQSDGCITGAMCDEETQQCQCQDNFRTFGDVCVLRQGERCVGQESLCGADQYCDAYDTRKCQCKHQYVASGDFCRLRVGIPDLDCSPDIPCVENATCDPDSAQCFCDQHFLTMLDATCGLKVGIPEIDCRQVASCVEHAYCDEWSEQCRCNQKFHPRSDSTCGLKVGEKLDCRQVTHCVDHATCDRHLAVCTCYNHFSPRRDGICGLKANTKGFDCRSGTPCVEHASCNSEGVCRCAQHYSVQRNGTCERSQAHHPALHWPQVTTWVALIHLLCAAAFLD